MNYLQVDGVIVEDVNLIEQGLENLSKENQLVAFKHDGFWYPMDTMRDKVYLENLWDKNKAPWKIWNE